MFMIMAAAGVSMTLVGSNSPPSPTSSTATSTFSRANAVRVTAVMISDQLGPSSMASAASRTSSVARARHSSETGTPLIWIRSLKRSRWGEVSRPVLYPAARRMLSAMAQALPLPLVPATWTQGYRRWGLPKASIRMRMRWSPGAVSTVFFEVM